MKLTQILIVLLLLCYFVVPVLADGEENVKIIKTDGTNTTDGIEKVTTTDNNNLFNLDIGNGDILSTLANPSNAMKVFSQIPPLRIIAIIVGSIVVSGAVFVVIVAFFLALGKIGIGSAHWDPKKGWKMIEHNKAAMIVLFIAVVTTFIFSALTLFCFNNGFKILGVV